MLVSSFFFLRSTEVQQPTPALKGPQQPSFDFDAHLAPHGLALEDEEEAEVRDTVDVPDDAVGIEQEDDAEEEELADEGTADEDLATEQPTRLHPSLRQPNTLARPFLPFTCEPCATLSPSHPAPPTCAKYARPPTESPSPFNPAILDRATLFPGSGVEMQRVLKRAIKSSQFGAKRVREGDEDGETKYEDEDPFRILVLGGSGESPQR